MSKGREEQVLELVELIKVGNALKVKEAPDDILKAALIRASENSTYLEKNDLFWKATVEALQRGDIETVHALDADTLKSALLLASH